MDREVKEQYQVLIQAKDMGGQLGGLAGTTTVNITLSDVNDNPPRFSKSECKYTFKVKTTCVIFVIGFYLVLMCKTLLHDCIHNRRLLQAGLVCFCSGSIPLYLDQVLHGGCCSGD